MSELAKELAEAEYGSPTTVKLTDGRAIRAKVTPDEFMTIEDDGDWYGKVAPENHRTNSYGYAERPDGFDGNAEKIQYDRSASVWWQPPEDIKRSDPDNFKKFRDTVREVLEFGYSIVTVEVLRPELDGYARPIVDKVASLAGNAIVGTYQETLDYRAEVIDDLLMEVGIDA